ncbi:MAG: M48 family metallopeptidase [Lachnospiraceae bacterium]|jgi:predicted metal-dependent hydrolase|nr:M48 family metallopeptidase [Lachnospiraceae bacterium]
MIEYTLTRQRRKTAAIYVRAGGVEVRAPLRMPKYEIDRFVAAKEAWIEKKLAEFQKQAKKRESFALGYGGAVRCAGREYPIVARAGQRFGFDEACFYMPPGLAPEDIKYLCTEIYRLIAKRELTKKVAHYAPLLDASPKAVKINGAGSRWGSCSSRGNLNFSWRLMMADEAVIDYVVVHELAHLKEMNHSPRFWALVAGVLPDYRERKRALRILQERLSGEWWE